MSCSIAYGCGAIDAVTMRAGFDGIGAAIPPRVDLQSIGEHSDLVMPKIDVEFFGSVHGRSKTDRT
jgi:hypothetical protein